MSDNNHCPRHESYNKDCYNCFMHNKIFKLQSQLSEARAKVERLKADWNAQARNWNAQTLKDDAAIRQLKAKLAGVEKVVKAARKVIPPEAYYPKNEGTQVALLAKALAELDAGRDG